MAKTWIAEVAIEARRNQRFVNETAERLMELLDSGSVISFSPNQLTMGFEVEAEGPATAATRAVARASRACTTANVGDIASRIIRIEIMTPEELAREVDEPNFPRLVGVAEIAELLGVSKQRVSELRREEWFPPPLRELAAGPVWTHDSIKRFVKTWPRKPGRPKKSRPARV